MLLQNKGVKLMGSLLDKRTLRAADQERQDLKSVKTLTADSKSL